MTPRKGEKAVSAKRNWTFEELKALWNQPAEGQACSNPECPNAHRIHILAESITITNLIVASELAPEIREAVARAGA